MNIEPQTELTEIQEDSFLDEEFSQLANEGVTQKILRTSIAGTETIVALFRCDLQAEQDRYVLNIPIHPSLRSIPEIETVVSAEGVRVRVTQCEKFGIRLELIVAQPLPEPTMIFAEAIISATLD